MADNQQQLHPSAASTSELDAPLPMPAADSSQASASELFEEDEDSQDYLSSEEDAVPSMSSLSIEPLSSSSSQNFAKLPLLDEQFFQSPVNRLFLCPICLCVLRNPVSCHEGHTFCSSCIFNALATDKICPLSRIPIESSDSLVPNQIVSALILEMPLKQCPHQCGQPFDGTVSELITHIKTTCPVARLTCPFAKYGCRAKFERSQEKAHLQANMEQHMALVMTAHGWQNSQLLEQKRRIAQLEQSVQQLSTKIAASAIASASSLVATSSASSSSGVPLLIDIPPKGTEVLARWGSNGNATFWPAKVQDYDPSQAPKSLKICWNSDSGVIQIEPEAVFRMYDSGAQRPVVPFTAGQLVYVAYGNVFHPAIIMEYHPSNEKYLIKWKLDGDGAWPQVWTEWKLVYSFGGVWW